MINRSHTTDYLIVGPTCIPVRRKQDWRDRRVIILRRSLSHRRRRHLWSASGSGASHNHLRSSLAPGAILPPWKQRERMPVLLRQGSKKRVRGGERWMESAASVVLWQGRKFFCSFFHIVHNLPVRVFLPPRRFVIHRGQNSQYEWRQKNSAVYSKKEMKDKKIALKRKFKKYANLI